MQTQLVCPNCNSANPAGRTLCLRCGKPLLGAHTAAQAPYATPPAPAYTYQSGLAGQQSYVGPQVAPQQLGQYAAAGAGAPVVARPLVGVGFWLTWVLATAAGWAIGTPLAIALGQALAKPMLEQMLQNAFTSYAYGSNPNTAFLQLALVLGAAAGATIGLSSGAIQWLAFRSHGFSGGAWPIASSIGGALGLAGVFGLLISMISSTDLLSSQLTPGASMLDNSRYVGLYMVALVGGALGLGLGFMQWLVLRSFTNKAGWWLLASPALWALALVLLAVLAGSAQSGSIPLIGSPNSAASLIAIEALFGGIVGAGGGLATGAALTLVLK